MSIYELRDYFQRQQEEASLCMVSLPEGLNKDSAEETYSYMRGQHHKYAALCAAQQP